MSTNSLHQILWDLERLTDAAYADKGCSPHIPSELELLADELRSLIRSS